MKTKLTTKTIITNLIAVIENLLYAQDHECDQTTIKANARTAILEARTGKRVENNQH